MNEKLWNKNYIVTLLAVVFAAFTHNAFTVVFPVYVNEIGGNEGITGMMMAGMVISGMITRLFCGHFMDKYGRKKTMVLGSILFAINTIAYCFVKSIPGVFVLRVLNGVSQGIFFPVPPTIVSDVSPKDKLVDALSYFGISSGISASIAPTVGLLILQKMDANIFFIVTSVFAIISVCLSLFIHYEIPHVNTQNKENENKIPKLKGLIEFSVLVPSFVLCFISLGNSSVLNFLGTSGLERNITNVSLFFLINNIVMIIVRLFIGKLEKKFPTHLLITIGMGLIAIAIFMIAFAYNIQLIILASILFGCGLAVASQLIQVTIYRIATDERRGAASTTYMLLGDIGTGTGAAVWGYVAVLFGYTSTYMISGLIVIIAIIIHYMYLKPMLEKIN